MDYTKLWDKMEYGKVYTASDLGVTAQSLIAMERRGMVIKYDTTPRTFEKKESKLYKILKIVKPLINLEYFTLYKEGSDIGMLCYYKNDKIMDCCDNDYNVDDVNRILVRSGDYYLDKAI